MKEAVHLLSSPTNYAVVQLPGRQFPGVVVQGDTLHSIIAQLQNIRQHVEADKKIEALGELTDISEQLSMAISRYITTCESNKIELPFQQLPK